MIGRVLVAALLVGSLLVAGPWSVSAQQTTPPEDCAGATLEWTGTDGLQPDAAGGLTPVVMIHGITGSSDMWRQWIEESINPFGEPIERAVFEQVNRIPGAVAYTFDYHDHSLKWVDAPEVGGRFAQAIDCLYEWAQRPIVVVAHSMGGLVTKWVAATDGPHGSRAEQIGLVVSLGTPFEGSDLLAGIHDVLDGAAAGAEVYADPRLAVLRILFLACGAAANDDADACGFFGVPDSDAGRALATGSDQLAALGGWHDGPEVVSLGGSIMVHDLASLGIFYSDAGWDSVDLGDIAVPTHSAVAGSDRSRTWACDYTLSLAESASDSVLGYIGLVPRQERADFVFTGVWTTPCYHGALATTIEIHNELLGTINDHITASARPKSCVGAEQVAFEALEYPPLGFPEAAQLTICAMAMDEPALVVGVDQLPPFLADFQPTPLMPTSTDWTIECETTTGIGEVCTAYTGELTLAVLHFTGAGDFVWPELEYVAPSVVATAFERWYDAQSRCRGGAGDDPATNRACEEWPTYSEELETLGWCYGRPGEASFQQSWHVCDE